MEANYRKLGYALLLLIPLIIIEFYPSYFALFPKLNQYIDNLVHVHFFLSVLWVSLLIVQPFLIINKKYKWHKLVGRSSFVIFPSGNKRNKPVVAALAFFTLVFFFSSKMVAQNTLTHSDKLKRFEGEWKLKDNVWKSKSGTVYKEEVNPNRSFVARAVSPENTILWEEDFDHGAWATLLWTYHRETGRVHHLSNTTDNNIGIGTGAFDHNNDLTIKIFYPNGCTNCHRVYNFHWITAEEFDFKATIYKEEKPTGDFYGGTFIKQVSNREDENRVKFVEIGVNVSDTARSMAFYKQVFGMIRAGDWHASKEMSAAAGVNSGRAFDLVILNLLCDDYVLNYKLNQTQNNVDPNSGKSPQGYGFEKIGASYFTVNVENVDPFIERIKANNINYKLVTLPNGLRVVLLQDPDGLLLEILGK